MLRFVQIRNNRYENRLIFLLLANKNIVTNGFVYFAFWGLQEEFSTLPCSPWFTS
jgi:hypothetical protein